MPDPNFLEPEVDHSCDEDGYPWDFDRGGDLGNYDEEGGDDEE